MIEIFQKIFGRGKKEDARREKLELNIKHHKNEQRLPGEYVVPPILKEDGLYAIESVSAESYSDGGMMTDYIQRFYLYDRREKIGIEVRRTTIWLLPLEDRYSNNHVSFIEQCLTGKIVPMYCINEPNGVRSFKAHELEDIVYTSVRQQMVQLRDVALQQTRAVEEIRTKIEGLREKYFIPRNVSMFYK